MAYAFLRTTVQTRSKGHTATGAVCYRMGLAATSTLLGKDGEPRHFNYRARAGILATGYAAAPGTDPSWGDPITWAHRIEAVDKRMNSRQCRDDVVGIPVELVEAGMAEVVAQAYADRLAKKHKTVVHWALHGPTRGGKNYHVHVLYPGRHVEGMTFARKRDRTQDKPEQQGDPDLVTEHKGIWSEICRGRGIELDWTSEAPGHHLGPTVCAVKRARLVEETRETIRETVAASTPGGAVPGERTLQAVAEIATRVNDGMTVTEMLERELEGALHGRPAPRPVPVPAPFQPEVLLPAGTPEVLPPQRREPEVLPLARTTPEVLPPVRTTPEVLVPRREAPEVLPPMKRTPEVLSPVRTAPEVLSPRRETPEVLPPTRRPEVLPTARRQAEVWPPREIVTKVIADQTDEQFPRETAATWSEVDRHLQLQQRQTLAHEGARVGAKDLSGRARRRGRSKDSLPPASPGRTQSIADWLLNCARQVLERFGLKPDAAPESEARRAPSRQEASKSSAPRPRPAPAPWERYQARWPAAVAGEREIFEELTGKSPPKALGGPTGPGIDNWRRSLGTMFHVREAPKPLPRSLAPADQASADAAVDAADYAGSLPSRYRARVDQERIVERSLEAEEKVQRAVRYRLASERKRQTLRDNAVHNECGADAQRLDREMRAERRQWRRHWDVLARHDTMLREEEREKDLQRLRESLQEHRSTRRGPERKGPARTR